MTNPMEEMSLPCPLDICDGSGIIERDDGSDNERDRKCPCRSDEGDGEDYSVGFHI